MAVTRLISVDDAEQLARLVTANRGYLAPWSPVQADIYFTADGQRAVLERDLSAYERGAMLPLAITGLRRRRLRAHQPEQHHPRRIPVRERGLLGQRVPRGARPRQAAVADVIGVGFGDLGLHRLEASTLLHNTPSQRVLGRNGFRPFAVVEAYLKIAGRWQDHILFQLLNQD